MDPLHIINAGSTQNTSWPNLHLISPISPHLIPPKPISQTLSRFNKTYILNLVKLSQLHTPLSPPTSLLPRISNSSPLPFPVNRQTPSSPNPPLTPSPRNLHVIPLPSRDTKLVHPFGPPSTLAILQDQKWSTADNEWRGLQDLIKGCTWSKIAKSESKAVASKMEETLVVLV